MACFQAVGTSCLTKVTDNHTSQLVTLFTSVKLFWQSSKQNAKSTGYPRLNKLCVQKVLSFPFPAFVSFLLISMKGSIFFRLFCEIPFVFHVFLVNFSRDFGARPAKIVSVVHALCLTAVFSWGNNKLKGNVKTCISGERINLEFLSFCHYSSAVNDLFDANSVKTLNKWWRLEGCGFSFGELFSECQVR